MHYHNISILGSPLEPFSYQSSQIITTGTKVSVKFRNRTVDGVIISSCEKPAFDTNEILDVSDFFYSPKQIELAKFISRYYFSSLGEALSLMLAFNRDFMDKIFIKDKSSAFESTIQLSSKQEKARSFLQKHKVSLLFGDTGSGKTEIYMKYFE